MMEEEVETWFCELRFSLASFPNSLVRLFLWINWIPWT